MKKQNNDLIKVLNEIIEILVALYEAKTSYEIEQADFHFKTEENDQFGALQDKLSTIEKNLPSDVSYTRKKKYEEMKSIIKDLLDEQKKLQTKTPENSYKFIFRLIQESLDKAEKFKQNLKFGD